MKSRVCPSQSFPLTPLLAVEYWAAATAWSRALLIPAILMCSAWIALAQSDTSARPPRLPKIAESGLPGGGGPGRFGPLADRLYSVLTEEQRASLREAVESQRDTMRGLGEKLREARKDLLTASIADKFDEETVRQKALAAAKIEAEMAVHFGKALSKMRPVLSAEQVEKLKDASRPDQAEGTRRRPDVPRDEHGLPLKQ
jgi:Spy/CpxP family protein refolding chaperone